MSDNSFDSTYDLIIPPLPPSAVTPEPQVIPYRRVEPATPPGPPQPPMEPMNKLSAEERLWFWLRRVAALCVILIGAGWLYFIPLRGLVTWGIGFGLVGAGLAMLMFAGPTDAERRGYHF